MPNTITQDTVMGAAGNNVVVRRIVIVSDGSEESDLVIFDRSTFDSLTTSGRIMRIQADGSSCQCLLEWDATTDVAAYAFDPSNQIDRDFRAYGGLVNNGGTGATGDLLLTTTNLDSGDVVTIIITFYLN